jgi:hypothetical protein
MLHRHLSAPAQAASLTGGGFGVYRMMKRFKMSRENLPKAIEVIRVDIDSSVDCEAGSPTPCGWGSSPTTHMLNTQLTNADAQTIIESISWLREHRLFVSDQVRDGYDSIGDGLVSVLESAGVEVEIDPDPIHP